MLVLQGIERQRLNLQLVKCKLLPAGTWTLQGLLLPSRLSLSSELLQALPSARSESQDRVLSRKSLVALIHTEVPGLQLPFLHPVLNALLRSRSGAEMSPKGKLKPQGTVRPAHGDPQPSLPEVLRATPCGSFPPLLHFFSSPLSGLGISSCLLAYTASCHFISPTSWAPALEDQRLLAPEASPSACRILLPNRDSAWGAGVRMAMAWTRIRGTNLLSLFAAAHTEEAQGHFLPETMNGPQSQS